MKKKLFSLALLVAGIMPSVFPAVVGAEAPKASASCVDYKVVLTMTPPANHSHWAIRIDDRSNSFQPTAMRPGDVIVDNYKANSYSKEGQSGELYNWWVHSVSKNGVWSDPTGGTVSCPPKAPVNLQASYDHPYVTVKWNPVKGAVRYAIRVDNTISPWDPKERQPGDHFREYLTETEFRFQAARDRKVVWWVHAIDKYGVWSEASWSNFTTK